MSDPAAFLVGVLVASAALGPWAAFAWYRSAHWWRLAATSSAAAAAAGIVLLVVST